MSRKLTVNDYEWVKSVSSFNEVLAKIVMQDICKVDVEYPEQLHKTHNYLALLSGRMKL